MYYYEEEGYVDHFRPMPLHPMHCWSPPTPPTRKVSLIKDRTDVKALCDACGRSFGAKKCSKCHAAAYCSISCQREAWSNHKGPCKRIGELNAELRAAIRY